MKMWNDPVKQKKYLLNYIFLFLYKMFGFIFGRPLEEMLHLENLVK